MKKPSPPDPFVPLRFFRVVADVTISMSTRVMARTKAEAKTKALDRPMQSLCHQCARGEDNIEWTTSGEFDGEPRNLHAEEE